MSDKKGIRRAALAVTLTAALAIAGCVTTDANSPQVRGRSHLISPQWNQVAPASTGNAQAIVGGPVAEYNRPRTIVLGELEPAAGPAVSASAAIQESRPPSPGLVAIASDNVIDPSRFGMAQGPAVTVTEGLGLGGPGSGGVVGVVVGSGTAGVAGTITGTTTGTAAVTTTGTATSPVGSTGVGIAGTTTAPGIAGPLSSAAVSSGGIGTLPAAGAVVTGGVAGTTTAPGVAGPISSQAVIGPSTGVVTTGRTSTTVTTPTTTTITQATGPTTMTVGTTPILSGSQDTLTGTLVAPAISSARGTLAITNTQAGGTLQVTRPSRLRRILGVMGQTITSPVTISGRGRAIRVTLQQ